MSDVILAFGSRPSGIIAGGAFHPLPQLGADGLQALADLAERLPENAGLFLDPETGNFCVLPVSQHVGDDGVERVEARLGRRHPGDEPPQDLVVAQRDEAPHHEVLPIVGHARGLLVLPVRRTVPGEG